MSSRIVEPAQQVAARLVGLLYVVTMASSVFGEMVVRGTLVVPGDAVATARNITGAGFLFRLGLLADVVTFVGVIALNWGLYVVLRPVGRHLALLAASFRLAEAAVATSLLAASLLLLRLLGSADYLEAFDFEQRAVLARSLLGAQATGMYVVFVLLGLGSAIYAALWYRSGYIARPFAALGVGASVFLSVVSALIVLFPRLGEFLNVFYMVPLGVFEVVLGLWLFVRGLPKGGLA
jgi:hypothetical protein